MRVPVGGEVWVEYGQTYVESDPRGSIPGLREAFAGQDVGLCGAAEPGFLWLTTGLHTGHVGLTAEVHDAEPALDPEWEEVVEVSFRPLSDTSRLAGTDLGLPVTDHRVRYCARDFAEGRDRDTRSPGEPPADEYLLQFWPAPPAPARVVRRTSPEVAHWHDWARALPPPPTEEERAEAARLAREAEERAAAERLLHRERWLWGGRLPSDTLRAVGGNVQGLLRYDTDLVHTLDAAGPGTQRRAAVLAAHRACEAAGLTALPWIVTALTALSDGHPLPPPFDDPNAMWESLSTDPEVPHRTALEAVPPRRTPYLPPSTPAREPRPMRAPGPPSPPVHSPSPKAAAPTGAHGSYAVLRPAGAQRTPHRISQPHFALPAIPAAADPDPLRAALEAVWHALGTYGDRYPLLLAEVWASCAGGTEE
ncbi:hypothetical protein [Streptomyces sp. CRN 30]|uniref:hypothetical protein n=1 Tax=Streptomyces sp. CRN 30 TaxID=3075613 RepID=UPI002A7EC2ED|nr:hypothetical protein [Streptomyces sp. CRN 30]